jgi:hypothetical protein
MGTFINVISGDLKGKIKDVADRNGKVKFIIYAV